MAISNRALSELQTRLYRNLVIPIRRRTMRFHTLDRIKELRSNIRYHRNMIGFCLENGKMNIAKRGCLRLTKLESELYDILK